MSDIPRKTKGLVWLRDQGECVRCGAEGVLNYHHRKLRRHAPKDEVHNPENLILLCGSGTTGCHGWVHANPYFSYAAGWLVKSWATPSEVPVLSGALHYLLDTQANRSITQEKAA
ncbi:HNH endonuclease [Arthrobacter pityocampae]|uniref:HNH endonuclease n=1 Tax=Arthrobacter pityocampae TaxID=547334 RepID=UPI0037362A59